MVMFRELITEARTISVESEKRLAELNVAWKKALKDIHELFGGYAAILGSLREGIDDLSYIEISLPMLAFDADELEPELTQLGVKKAFRENGLDVDIVHYRTYTDKAFIDKRKHCWVLELTLTPSHEITTLLRGTNSKINGSYMIRKRKR